METTLDRHQSIIVHESYKGAIKAYYSKMSHAVNSYGDGKACNRIVRALKGENSERYVA